MIFNENEKILSAEQLKNSDFMKYEVLFIRNVKRDDENKLIECSIIAMSNNISDMFTDNEPEGTQERFITNKGAVDAFGFLGLGWH